MKQIFKLFWYYLETRYTKVLRYFNIRKDESIIPKGIYCYEYDEERNDKEPCKLGSYWIKPCKYYRSTPETRGIACTYTGFYGHDCCLYDQCKICGVNDEINQEEWIDIDGDIIK